jgi:hypothetical protein
LFACKDKKGIEAHAIASPEVLYERIVRRKIKGINRFFVQPLLEAKPKVKNPVCEGVPGYRAFYSSYCF